MLVHSGASRKGPRCQMLGEQDSKVSAHRIFRLNMATKSSGIGNQATIMTEFVQFQQLVSLLCSYIFTASIAVYEFKSCCCCSSSSCWDTFQNMGYSYFYCTIPYNVPDGAFGHNLSTQN